MPSRPWSAIVPVRAGSKGLPGKNMRLLCGKPLYRHAVDQALAAGASRVIITTDIVELQSTLLPAGVEVLKRSDELAGDAIPMAPVVADAIQNAGIQGVAVLLQATSPLRENQDILNALNVYASNHYQLVMSVTEADRSVLKWGLLSGDKFKPLSDPRHCFENRQSLPNVYKPNGAVYVFDSQWFVRNKGFSSENIGVILMPAERSFDVDSQVDFERCSNLMSLKISRRGVL